MNTIDDFTATINFKQDMLSYAVVNWKDTADKINEMFKIELTKDDFSVFEYFLAVLFVQSRAPYNIYDTTQGYRVWRYLINSFSMDKNYGKASIDTLNGYLEGWDHHVSKKVNPLGAAASVLLYKLKYKEKDSDVILGTVVGDVLGLSPAWWKNFSEKNNIYESAIPIDSKGFSDFMKENR